MVTVPKQRDKDQTIQWLSPEEGKAMFDRQARKIANLSGDEFIEQWERGDFREIADTAEHRRLVWLAMLIPFGRPDA